MTIKDDPFSDDLSLSSDGVDVLLSGLRANAAKTLDLFTERETEFLIALAHTKTYKQIAKEMGVGETRVKQYATAVKGKLGVTDRSDAVAAFVLARHICDRPVYTEKHLRNANFIINRLVSDHTIEEAYSRITSQEFREYLRDLRSSGPKAKTAMYGPWWKIGSGVRWALYIMAAALLALSLGVSLDVLSN